MEATVHSYEQALRDIVTESRETSQNMIEMGTQLDNNSQVLNNSRLFFGEMKTHVDGLQSQVQRINGRVTPSFLPFKSQEDIDRYEIATPEEINQLKTYVMHFQGQTSLQDNVRYVLQDNILFTEELLAKINDKEQSEKKNIIFFGKRLDHDLYGIFSSMFSNTTVTTYQNVVQAALKAAYNRTNSRTKRKNYSNTTQKRRKRGFVNESFYKKPYSASEDVQRGEDEPERIDTAIEDQQD
ncbi:uncharacterized protein LOC103574263 [Microplitis demolitor]|uniref:uncharacterized protein LOC103574263 n=1 Tax=Microplitis demolitor TaxID=69319 RepID=UPI0004CD8873|nr:uncharacterized protein LOC103574263 [Microplitis demolitor]XP_053597055.1 uncharacterized protein LOC103574263 [Microplitis demolitor]XP_053597056.1 uncharacterized protein LOC103574263 [Microplitis demolitor]